SVIVPVGRSAPAGVLVKNAEALEIMEKVDTLVVDKTGTLTEGKPRLDSVVAVPGFSEAEVLRLAGSLERGSEHPLAAAIVSAAGERKLQLSEARDFRSVTGKGITGYVEGRSVAFGSLSLLEELKIDTLGLRQKAEDLGKDGQTVMFIAVDGKATGLVSVTDPIKESTAQAISRLRR